MPRPCFYRTGIAVLGLIALLTGGCDWLSKPSGDPKREGNYQDGLRWVDQARWDSARESFYHALESNPQNLHAHLALGDLYRTHLTNQVLALFHYSRYIEIGRLLNHGEFHDQSAIDGIRNAEVELARTFAERMFRDQQQFELDGLRRTNVVLVERIDVLNRHVALLTQRLVATTNSLVPMPQQPVPQPQPQPSGSNGRGPVTGTPGGNTTATNRTQKSAPTVLVPPGPRARTDPEPAVPTRTHRVQSGDTLNTIARRYNIKLTSLQTANPGASPRTLKAGQVLVIPPH